MLCLCLCYVYVMFMLGYIINTMQAEEMVNDSSS